MILRMNLGKYLNLSQVTNLSYGTDLSMKPGGMPQCLVLMTRRMSNKYCSGAAAEEIHR